MDYSMIGTIIEVYALLTGAMIVAFGGAISLFYQERFKINTHFYLFLIPFLILIMAIIQIFMNNMLIGKMVEAVAGILSLLLCLKLYLQMTRGGA